MSGFFGIFSPTEKSIDLEAFEQMRKASEREGFDGMETVIEDNIALGHLMLRVSPESKFDKQPLRSSCGNYLLVGHFRLDYRDELGDKLGLIQSELESTPDSVLVMMAYQKWKEKCVNHLEGDWAFSVKDKKENKLILFRDKHGYSSLFYTIHQGCLYFSSDVLGLLNITKINYQLNKLQLFSLLNQWGTVRSGLTTIDNIFILPNSSYLIFDSLTSYAANIKEWESEFSIGESDWKYEEDFISVLHSIFALAIKSGGNTNIETGIFLSSGFDSSVVAHYLAKTKLFYHQKISSYTSYPYYLDKIPPNEGSKTNEEPLVIKFVKSYSNISPLFLNFPESKILSFESESLIRDPVTPLCSINSFWINGIFDLARTHGVKRMFCGQMGNFTISWDGTHKLSYLLIEGRLTELLRDLFFLVKAEKKNFIFILYKYLLIDFLRFFKVQYNRKIVFFSARQIFKQFNFRIDKKDWRKQYKDMLGKPGLFFSFDPENLRLNFYKQSAYAASLKWKILAHHNGMEIVDPTSDGRISDFLKSARKKIVFSSWH
jgi:asparagine synthase (glutamine-hydrolysing)